MTPNLNEATSLVNSIPLVKESIPVLMKLANGSNPNIPSYMALGRLQQIKAMIEHSQQPQMPQGTVKQNLERSVANMGMMNGRQQQMQQSMMQQGITAPGPAPEGVPQPQPMPQPEQMPQQPQEVMAAHGGILHAQTDPDMFNFAPGGIVAFAKEGEVKDKEKDKDKKSQTLVPNPPSPGETLSALLDAIKSGAINVGEAIGSGVTSAAGAVSDQYDRMKADAEKRRAIEKTGVPLRNPDTNEATAVDRITGSSGFKPYVLPPSTRLLDARPAGDSSGFKPYAPPAAAAAPGPAAAPRPPAAAPAAPAAPAAASGDVPVTQQGVGALNNIAQLKKYRDELTPDNKYINGIGTAYTAAKPETYDQQKELADTAALYKSLGIGTYGENRRKQMEQRAKEFEGNRMSKLDRLLSLGSAFSRPGARAGDMGQRSVEMNEAEREARERFQTAQDALMNTVELADEAIRTGKATKIIATKEAYKKALQEYKMAGVEVAKTQAQTEGLRQQTGTQAATSLLNNEMQMQSDLAKSASLEKIAAANNVSAQAVAAIQARAAAAGYARPSEQERFANEYFAVVKSQGQAAADAWLAQQEKVRAVSGGVKYGGQDREVEREIKIQAEIRAQTEVLAQRLATTKDPAKRAAIQAQIDAAEKKIRADVARAAGDAPPPNAVKLVKP